MMKERGKGGNSARRAMPIQIVHQDITKMRCDAAVNPTDRFYSGGGGTDLAIHRAAGIGLEEECSSLAPLRTGEVAVTRGYLMPCRYIIHTVGPVWTGGACNEEALLRGCYINAMIKARRLGLQSVAFPLISSGTFGFPKDRVLRIAIDAVSDFLFSTESDMQVFICIIDRNAYELIRGADLRNYIERNGCVSSEERPFRRRRRIGNIPKGSSLPYDEELSYGAADSLFDGDSDASAFQCSCIVPEDYQESKEQMFSPAAEAAELEEMFCMPQMQMPLPEDQAVEEELRAEPKQAAKSKEQAARPKARKKGDGIAETIKLHDDTFAVLLLKLIDKKGMGDVECYKKANVSKNTFWKINNDPKYKPSKPTVIAFAIALELSISETEALLKSAGFALSGNNYFDVIIEFYITNGIYDVFEINAALYQYDQICLGC